MKGKPMPRSLLYVSAVVVVLAAVVTTLKVTTHSSSPTCPKCHSKNTGVRQVSPESTAYQCRDCFEDFYGPPTAGFSWVAAFEDWLSN